MTEKEIKKLKPGDKFKLEYEVISVHKNTLGIKDSGEAQFSLFRKGERMLEIATLVKPAPKFEVGDTVRVVPDPLSGRVHGAHYCQQLVGREGVIEGIATDDDENIMWIHMDAYTHK